MAKYQFQPLGHRSTISTFIPFGILYLFCVCLLDYQSLYITKLIHDCRKTAGRVMGSRVEENDGIPESDR